MIKFSLPSLITFLRLMIQIQAQQPDQVIEFFRHGARGPISNYDPQWPESQFGKLTVVGMVEHYDLGKKIAAKYPHLVASGYNPKDIYGLSNYAERTLESAVIHVSSIFRGTTSTVTQNLPRGQQSSLIAKFRSSLPASEASRGNYVPVHVNVVTGGSFEELIFNGEAFCEALSPLVDENETSTQMKDGWTAFQPSIQEANSYLSQSQKITSMNKLYFAYDAFNCGMADGKILPGGITDTDLVESLSYGQEYYMYVSSRLQTLQRQLASWPVLKVIKDHLVNFRQGENAKKLVLLSGHDNNIRAALTALDVVNPDCLLDNYEKHKNGKPLSYPNCHHAHFASNLIFEFYNHTTSPYVKFYFNDIVVPLCNGQESCSYKDLLILFEKAYGGIDSIETWNQQCGNSPGLSLGAKIGIGIGSAVALFIIAGLGRWIYRKRKLSLSKIKLANSMEKH